MAGQAAAPRRQLGVADQEASLNLARLARLLAQIWGEWQPDIIVTHPYEGGHPDHDATAFAVHAACGLLRRQHRFPPLIIEMTSYHNCEGRLESSQFLPCSSRSAVTIWLTESRRECKRQLLDCFTTQQKVLKAFRLECERFRLAPRYDFTQPPHLGVLYYEMFDWGMTGRRWRSLAAAALDELASSPKDPVRTPQPCV
jgi:LmbE family N-acetylglucosaminyl deacetylase